MAGTSLPVHSELYLSLFSSLVPTIVLCDSISLPDDLEATRRTIVARELVATASAYLTADIAMSLPFETLVSIQGITSADSSPTSPGRTTMRESSERHRRSPSRTGVVGT